MSDFADHFSGHAAAYSAHRPRYPDALFAYLAAESPSADLAWDCGCGNGQASVALAAHFDRVLATDASAAQLEQVEPHPRVVYEVAAAEACPLEKHVADLVTVAQAAHWFDHERFHPEVRRVLCPGGLFAMWAYGLHEMTPAIDAVIREFYDGIIGPYWPARRRFIHEQYRTLPFPFAEMETPAFEMAVQWSLEELLDYIGTWSAVRRYRDERGSDPIALIRDDLATAWNGAGTRDVRWPLYLRAGRAPA